MCRLKCPGNASWSGYWEILPREQLIRYRISGPSCCILHGHIIITSTAHIQWYYLPSVEGGMSLSGEIKMYEA